MAWFVKGLLIGGLCLVNTYADAQQYLIYLHGKIIEDQGIHAVETARGFGEYQYNDILAAFRQKKFIVMSEVRSPNTDVRQYAHKVAKQVDSLIKQAKVAPDHITIVGASKGASIAMFASTYIQNADVKYVFMSACNESSFLSNTDISITGNVLSIYETSDNIGSSCMQFKERAKKGALKHYSEIALNTGLQHGYFYKPRPEWMNPVVRWAQGNFE